MNMYRDDDNRCGVGSDLTIEREAQTRSHVPLLGLMANVVAAMGIWLTGFVPLFFHLESDHAWVIATRIVGAFLTVSVGMALLANVWNFRDRVLSAQRGQRTIANLFRAGGLCYVVAWILGLVAVAR
jgi:hypothetical protein